MQVNKINKNEDIDLYLALGDREHINEAVVAISSKFKNLVFSRISQNVLSANQQDKEDIYQEFLLAVFRNAIDGKYESDSEKLSAYLVKIAENKAKTWARKKCSREKEELYDRDILLEVVDEGIKGSGEVKEAWELAHANESRPFILRAIYKLIPKLPKRERQVAEIIYMFYEYSPTDNDIRDKIEECHNEVLTTESVKSARCRLYKKLRERLQSIA